MSRDITDYLNDILDNIAITRQLFDVQLTSKLNFPPRGGTSFKIDKVSGWEL
ncbi:MAG TPA: hypothetical protein IGS17_19695 [Oscillatoriales cyanobacterium M59_W2019_021]|nr:hypothetical protein [Oscillatoriales cyanobacterium M4454_W2019_049]HIK53120.1 hypothetical protein [Oscillatoriales cyanobacterium M59_W2019_021]